MSLDSVQAITWFEPIVEAMPDAIVLADENGRIALVNRNAESLFGYSRAELLGRGLEFLLPQRLAHVLSSSQARAAGRRRELVGLRKDGSEVPIEIGLNPVEMPARAFTLASIVAIAERQRAEEILQHMAALVESADDAILSKSLDGVVRSWNPGAVRLLGYRAEEIIGKSITLLIPDDRQNEETLILDQIRSGKHVAHFETVRRRKDGSAVDVSLTISPIRDRGGSVVGASKIMRDISARRRAEMDLRRSLAELEQMNKELDDFVYTASHDLRTPLTGVSTVAQWILEDDRSLAPQSRERLSLIQKRIERLMRLLDDIRDYARAGRAAETQGAALTAAELVADVAATLHIPGSFAIRGDPSLEAVRINRVPLEQVLHNLIGNAIKHHDRAAGTVTVSVMPSGGRLRFSVTDDGPGIPEEYHESIFEMFKTLHPRDVVEGSGMGLALVKKIVGRMGGQCGVEAAADRGSRFWFDWPRFGASL